MYLIWQMYVLYSNSTYIYIYIYIYTHIYRYTYIHTYIHNTHFNIFILCNDKCTCCAVTVPEYKYINVFNVTKFTRFSFRHGAKALSGPRPPHYRGFTITLKHTTVGRTPLDEWSARRRDLYLTTHSTQHSQQTNIHASGGIRTRNPSKRTVADPLLRSVFLNLCETAAR